MKFLLAFFLLATAASNLLSQVSQTNNPVLPPLNDLYRDFIYSEDNVVLEHSLPNGKWRVTLNMGDANHVRKGMQVKAEEKLVASDINSRGGQFSFVDRFGGSDTPTSFDVEVTDGSLTLEFGIGPRTTGFWVLNHISITNLSATGDDGKLLTNQFRYDFGPNRSPVQPGYKKISDSELGPFSISANVAVADRKIVPNQFIDLFSEHEYPYSGERYGERVFRYRLYEPASHEKEARYPLIVWLHGYGESGDDNLLQLRWLRDFLLTPEILERHQFYLLAVQCPIDDPVWAHSQSENLDKPLEDMADICNLICLKTIQDYPIDTNRVYLSGLSSGGIGAWNVGARFSHQFAAIVPLASPGGDKSVISELTSVPIWAFTNNHDPVCSVEDVRQYVDSVNAAGGNAHFTGLDAPGHIARPFEHPELEVVDWMFAKRRGDSAWWLPPGSQPSKWPIRHLISAYWPRGKYFIFVIGCAWLVKRKISKSRISKQSAISPTEE